MSLLELTALLGNLGEFLGSIGVLATLIYLALQVRQSKELRNRLWWTNTGRAVFSDNFVTFVDDLLKDQQATDQLWKGHTEWANP